MGTSTGYSAPGSWGPLKSEVTRAANEGTASAATAGSILGHYVQQNGGAARMSGGGGSGGTVGGSAGRAVAQRLGGFISAVGEVGLEEALRREGLADLVGRPLQEILAALLNRLGGPASSIDDVDARAIGERANAKAVASAAPRDLDAGRYPVVLEPSAVSTLVGFLSFIGLGGRQIVEERSPLSGRAGERVAAPAVTLVDDAARDGTLGIPFDFEGVRRRRVAMIDGGVFKSGVFDLRTAKQAGTTTTGHALPAPNPEGPFPLNVFMEPGDATLEEMIASTERGLLVTRFHYTNVVHPVESTITGMTRDGTFLIEDGEVKHPVKNFRFTQSILEALRDTTMIGRETELASEFFFSASRVPALQVGSFNFSGRSDH